MSHDTVKVGGLVPPTNPQQRQQFAKWYLPALTTFAFAVTGTILGAVLYTGISRLVPIGILVGLVLAVLYTRQAKAANERVARMWIAYGLSAVAAVVIVFVAIFALLVKVGDVAATPDETGTTATPSNLPAAPAVTYSTDPVERGKQCLAAGALPAPSPLTADGAYTSWMKNLMVAQKNHDLNQLSCAFYDIGDTNAAWKTFKDFAPNTISNNDPFVLPNSGTVSGNILVEVAGQTVTLDNQGLRLEVVLRLSSAGSADTSNGIWMASNITLTYTAING